MKRPVKIICILLCAALILTALYFVFAFLGNPISWLLANHSANKYLDEQFGDSDFLISDVSYNLKNGEYYAKVRAPESLDRHFTVYFNGWGQYQYDTYDSITEGYNTLARIGREYNDLVDSRLQNGSTPFDISIVIGELKVAGLSEIYSYTDKNGNTAHYTLDKDYGLDLGILEVDEEYDILSLGADCGRITLYIHDEDVSVARAAELLLEVKNYLDENQIPFHAIHFSLCEPRNENGQNTGDQITLYDFLYSDIYEDGLTERVQQHWEITQEHYAIQDGLKTSLEKINPMKLF